MSSEEKQELLPKKEDVAVPSKRPTVPVDYSKKTFYDYLGIKKDASMETIESTYAELSKKYNPITNPDEIDRYQTIYFSGKNLTNTVVKKLYDEYDETSVIFYNIFNEYVPFETESGARYVVFNLAFTAIFLALICCGIIGIYGKNFFVYEWYIALLPTIICTVIYLIYSIAKTLQDLKKSKCNVDTDKKDEKDKKDKKENCECKNGILINNICNIVLASLLILFQFILIKYLNSEKKCCISLVLLPYILFEIIILVRDTLKFLKGVKAIKSGKEVDCPLLKDNIFLKYLIGKANVKCTKDGEKNCSSCLIGILFYNIYYIDIFRFAQNILFSVFLFKTSTSQYIIYFLPTLLIFFAAIVEKILKYKIGYINNTKESLIDAIKLVFFGIIFLTTTLTTYCLKLETIPIYVSIILFVLILAIAAGFFIGVFPFILLIEYKGKHDEHDIPF